MNTNQIALWVIVAFSTLLFTGCSDEPISLTPNFTLMHEDGYEVAVVHVANDWKTIRDVCDNNKYVTEPKANGCAYMPTRSNPVCRVYSPNPKGLGDWTWLHEVGAYPDEPSVIFGHCEGMTHDRESERF